MWPDPVSTQMKMTEKEKDNTTPKMKYVTGCGIATLPKSFVTSLRAFAAQTPAIVW